MYVAKCDLDFGYENEPWEITKGSVLKEKDGQLYYKGKLVCDIGSYMEQNFIKKIER